MDAPEDKTIRSALTDLSRIIGYLKPFKKQFLLVLLIVVAANITTLASPYVAGRGLNDLARLKQVGTRDEILASLGRMIGQLLALGLITVVLIRIRPVVSTSLSVALLRRLRTMVYGKIQELSFNYLDRLTNGQIIERATGDVTQVQQFLTASFVHVFDAVITIVVMLAFMISIDLRMALIAMAPFPVVMYLFAKIGHRVRVGSRRARDQADTMTTQLAEGIAGVRVIRSFGTEKQVRQEYRQTLLELCQRAMHVGTLRAFGMTGIFQIAHLIEILLVVLGGILVIRGQVEVGFFMTYLIYVGMFIWRVQPLLHVGDSAQEARAAFERITAVLDADPDVADADRATDLPPGEGKIEFRHVSFAYQDAPDPDADVTERMILQTPPTTPAALIELNLTVAPGEIIALVGPTGAGKSTIASLLPRFYDPTAGMILIDGKDIRQVRLENLRKNIALVFQETFLFRGTIAENIAYGLPDVDPARIREAAEMAQADDFIRELPLKYGAPIGERGVTLSGGQRQRLAIARAILLKPRILVLDDATASVDPTTEYKIRQSLKALMEGRTTLLIAHRLPTIRAADRIVVLNAGRIEDVGTHEELLGRNAFYQTLHQAQMDELGAGEEPQ